MIIDHAWSVPSEYVNAAALKASFQAFHKQIEKSVFNESLDLNLLRLGNKLLAGSRWMSNSNIELVYGVGTEPSANFSMINVRKWFPSQIIVKITDLTS